MKKLLLLSSFTWFFIICACSPIQTPLELLSPDGNVKIVFNLTENGKAHYRVKYKDLSIIEESSLKLEFKQSGEWGSNLIVKDVKNNQINETYSLVVGKSSSALNNCNEMQIMLQEANGDKRKTGIDFRAYNDGIAFRYVFPRQKEMSNFELLAENSRFHLSGNHKCWALQLGSFTTSYEKEFDPIFIADIKEDAIVGLPLTIEMENGPVLAIAEANLSDYAGMYIAGVQGEQNTLVSKLSPLPKGEGVCVKGIAPHVSPWRVILIGEKPGDLIESNIILNLNEPLAIKEPSWIKSGRCAWDWWSGQVVDDPSIQSGMNDATMKHYIDFAAENNLEYMLIDAGWSARDTSRTRDITRSIPEISIPDLVTYAKNKNVNILLWLHWTNVKKQMYEAFPLYEKWGVKGVKIDFMDRDDQEMVNFYSEMVKTAAKHHLMVDFHGAYKPTGLRRTWPNLMTREGILGLEYLKWSDRTNAEHNTIIPFTRMLVGPMDYTPGGFLNVKKENFSPQGRNPMVPTTRCHQLALFVIIESPLQMLADAPAHYRNQPGLDFLRIVPATWDETKIISGEIGEYIAVARKSGESWFIGAITDENKRSLDLSIDFLPDGEYEVTMWSDGPGADQIPTRVTKAATTVSAQEIVLPAVMNSSGGFVAVIEPVK